MKKTAKSKKRVTRPSRTRSRQASPASFSFQRIVVITTCLVIVFAVVLANKNKVTQSVAGISVARGLFSQVNVGWDPVYGATSYNLYYKQTDDHEFTNSVRNIPADITEYTVSYLTKGKKYDYKLAVVGANGQEFFWTEVHPLSEPESM